VPESSFSLCGVSRRVAGCGVLCCAEMRCGPFPSRKSLSCQREGLNRCGGKVSAVCGSCLLVRIPCACFFGHHRVVHVPLTVDGFAVLYRYVVRFFRTWSVHKQFSLFTHPSHAHRFVRRLTRCRCQRYYFRSSKDLHTHTHAIFPMFGGHPPGGAFDIHPLTRTSFAFCQPVNTVVAVWRMQIRHCCPTAFRMYIYIYSPRPRRRQNTKVMDRNVEGMKDSSPDYIDGEDFENRLDFYREAYETVEVCSCACVFAASWLRVPAWVRFSSGRSEGKKTPGNKQ